MQRDVYVVKKGIDLLIFDDCQAQLQFASSAKFSPTEISLKPGMVG